MADWRDKVVLVTGGSAGLGLEIGRAFGARGARVVLAARGVEGLAAAESELAASGVTVLAVPADVTRQADVDRLFEQTLAHFGRLDVLVNNAGRSTRSAVLDTSPDDFAELIDVNFLSAVRCTRAAAPHLLRAGGSLVNIGSLAAKSASRFYGAYPATKFALAAYSQQLRLELSPQGLHVLLVCPGPIARRQPRASSDLPANIPEEARRPGGGVKAKAIDPRDLAEQIIAACEARRTEIVRPAKARMLFALAALWPRLGDWLLLRNT